MSDTPSAVAFDPTSPEFIATRHKVYRHLRDEDPACVLPGPVPMVLLSRDDDIRAVLNDRDVRMRQPGTGSPPWLGTGPAARMNAGQMLYADPPEHTRLRKVVSPAFRPRGVDDLRQAITRAVEQQVEVIREKNEFDIVADFAEVVPAVAVCTILGIPEDDWEALIRRAVDFVLVLAPMPLSDEELARADDASSFYLDYFTNVVEDRRHHPRGDDDFVTVLNRAHADGRMTEDELLVTVHSVLNAGFETTMSALANGLEAMLVQADPWRQFAADAALSPAAVEETLRWEAPAQLLTRTITDDMVLPSGSTIDAGTHLILAIASANRDERRWQDPDVFDLSRDASGHLTFSAGRHLCIGAHLGRMEMDIALRALAREFPEMALRDEGAPREHNPVFPTLKRLLAVAQP